MSMIDSVTIRPVLADELPAVAQVRAIGFGGEPEMALNRLQSNPRYNAPHIVVAIYKGKIIGTTTAFSAKMWLSGVPMKIGAVAGVATLPEYRRKGVAAKMMRFIIGKMFNEGDALSILYPFSPAYYNKFDYGTIGDLHAYRIKTDNLRPSEEGHKVRPFAPQDSRMMRVIYKGQMTWHNGWFTRSDEWWEQLINRWPGIMVFDNEGMIEGYYAYDLRNDDDGHSVLNIIELFAADGPAYQGLIGHLARQKEADIVEYLAPPNTPLRHLMRHPMADNAQNRTWIFNDLCHVTPGPMGRIINLSKALTTRFYNRTISGERVLKITDPLIPTNEDALIFRVVDGRPEVHSAKGLTPQIETDIRTFSQILCGYLSAKDAQYIGWLRADESSCSWLDKIIADTPLFIQAGDWF